MLEEMVKAIIKKSIAADYPHLKLPAVVFASIKSATKLDTYEIEELVILNDDTGSSFNGHITANWYEYTLTIPADVSGVVVTPTASNKNYQVRTSVGGTEYARTAEVPVADGAVITVKCGDPS